MMFGWFGYWQELSRSYGLEIVDNLHFRLNLITNCSPCPIQGAGCATTATGGTTVTDATLTCWSTLSDELNPITEPSDGDAIVTSAHEYAHSITDCAFHPGKGCNAGDPNGIARPPAAFAASDWHPVIFGSARESIPVLISQLLTGDRYANARSGNTYPYSWNYSSHDNPLDDFGTPSEAQMGYNCRDPANPCATGQTCVYTTSSRQLNHAGICAVNPIGGICPPGLFPIPLARLDPGPPLTGPVAITTQNSVSVCWYDSYRNSFWDIVGQQLAFTTSTQNSIVTTLAAADGQRRNASRDLVIGADAYYPRYLANGPNRFEVTRAVRPAYTGSGFTEGDDYTDVGVRAPTLMMHSTIRTPLWWGSGPSEYPAFEVFADVDTFAFRGQTGQQILVQSIYRSGQGSPYVFVINLSNGAIVQLCQSLLCSSGPLPQTAWYSVAVMGLAAGATWEGSIGLEVGSDDYASTVAEAHPIAIGSSTLGQFSAGDVDAFQVDVPSGSATFLELSGHNSAITYEVLSPAGVPLASGSLQAWNAQVMLPVGAARYIVRLSSSTASNYTVGFSEWCGQNCYPNEFGRVSQTTTWGDRFAGSLGISNSHTFSISLAEGEVVSASVTEAPGCNLELQLHPPTSMTRFDPNNAPFRWRDGGPALDIHALHGRAPHGSIRAPLAGTYKFRVRNMASGTVCPQYLLELMRSNTSIPTLPAW